MHLCFVGLFENIVNIQSVYHHKVLVPDSFNIVN